MNIVTNYNLAFITSPYDAKVKIMFEIQKEYRNKNLFFYE